MTNEEAMERALANGGIAEGASRPPKFGEWMRGIWASDKNPQRDGQYVRTVIRTGRVNRGKFYELTDGRGSFWQYPVESTCYINPK
jgi:hypothetical protein